MRLYRLAAILGPRRTDYIIAAKTVSAAIRKLEKTVGIPIYRNSADEWYPATADGTVIISTRIAPPLVIPRY